MSITEYVGGRIREIRKMKGLSQEALAQAMGTTANTISRWETATYRPTIDDLERLSRFFEITITDFFPPEEEPDNVQITALLRAAKQLSPDDLEELRNYAEFRKARGLYRGTSKASGSSRKI
ncbi:MULTISPECIES: helix-turn-helix transcriptional regulator [Trichocoleus]|uniref:Helix-turn-helix domain-containing protein n=1 Tax=Trichocoleus desertorum GB2-A4 TaxID=2933944 RepID=A0ABV0JG75_9CYAN|nr:helix-turn-helix transcriptional regulator [Trichocoleus sp. FACHB-46]MBD1865273.1 helix-turn-helix transcriptional regulator [Trichocoleus sp. FACHB-46]